MRKYCILNGGRPQRSRRIIGKLGDSNISVKNLPERLKRYIRDVVTTIIETRWRIVISAFLVSTFGCWIFFAVLWHLIAYAHNDLTFDTETGLPLHDGKMTCIRGVETLTGFFLLSFEIQTTVGFGERYPNEECPEAIFLFIVHIVCGIAIDGAMISIICAKLTRSPKRPFTSKFSRKAVICQRDSKLCLMFRICDPNELHIVDSKVHACLIGEIKSAVAHYKMSDTMELLQYPLKLQDDGRVHIIFPVIVCHVIDEESPLYTLSASQFLEKRLEIIVTYSGASASTGQVTEEKTSYLSREIEWGHRFLNMVEYDEVKREYFIDYDKFDITMQFDTPLCSAQRLDEINEKLLKHYVERQYNYYAS